MSKPRIFYRINGNIYVDRSGQILGYWLQLTGWYWSYNNKIYGPYGGIRSCLWTIREHSEKLSKAH